MKMIFMGQECVVAMIVMNICALKQILSRIKGKLREKVDKFPKPDDKVISIIVINCKYASGDFLDAEDARMIMYGKTKNPMNMKFWENEKIDGMLEPSSDRKKGEMFKERISAVWFISHWEIPLFKGEHCYALNYLRSDIHKERVKCFFNNSPWFS